MPIFEVKAVKVEDGGTKTFFVDNQTLKIYGEPVKATEQAPVVDLAQREKTGPFSRVKIQMGLKCNYSCSYCSQRFVERADETTPKDIGAFLEQFDLLPVEFMAKVEFWGGEPFVYWKTLKPLAEALRRKRHDLNFGIITNGSLLTKEKVNWLFNQGFSLSISHDGPGQSMRGEDPLEKNREAIEYALKVMAPRGRFSFNSVLNAQNQSRTAVIDWFAEKFPGYDLKHGEMDIISAYDDGGLAASAWTEEQAFALRRSLFSEIRNDARVGEKCPSVRGAVQLVIDSNGSEPAHVVKGQKCGMDQSSAIALDLRGNVLTCQNVSSVEIATNGSSHLIGTIQTIEDVRLPTSTHWSQRDNCPTCPVLKLCKGSCMFLQDELFAVSCESAYTENIVNFAIGFETVTGYVPVQITQNGLPDHRSDIFGPEPKGETVRKPKPRKIIPIALHTNLDSPKGKSL